MKYRIWDKLEKRYVKDVLLTPTGVALYEYTDIELDDYVIEQYTGINDINGKEIYEGDIVDWIDDDEEEMIDKIIVENLLQINFLETNTHLEIVGNIHDE